MYTVRVRGNDRIGATFATWRAAHNYAQWLKTIGHTATVAKGDRPARPARTKGDK